MSTLEGNSMTDQSSVSVSGKPMDDRGIPPVPPVPASSEYQDPPSRSLRRLTTSTRADSSSWTSQADRLGDHLAIGVS